MSKPVSTREWRTMTRRLLSYPNDADTAEALAYGYGVPPEPVLTEVRCLWWRQHRQGLRLPAERRVTLIAGGPV